MDTVLRHLHDIASDIRESFSRSNARDLAARAKLRQTLRNYLATLSTPELREVVRLAGLTPPWRASAQRMTRAECVDCLLSREWALLDDIADARHQLATTYDVVSVSCVAA